MSDVHYDFDVGDPVRITAIGERGRVAACMTSVEGPEYRVAYWYEGVRRAEWLPAQELERI